MRWIAFFILALCAVIAQSTLAVMVSIGPVRPDFLLTVAVFLGLFARRTDAVLAAWLLGTLADVFTIERFGLMGLTYGLVALAVVGVRELVFRDLILTQIALTGLLCFVARLLWCVYRNVLYDSPSLLSMSIVVETVGVAVYTAILSWPIHRLLESASGVLGLPRPKYTFSSLRRQSAGHV